MKVEWSAFAIEDRDRIFDYIESESPKAAVLVDSRIEEQINRLAQYPEIGRPGRVEDTRELGHRSDALNRALSHLWRCRAHSARAAWGATMAG